ncbi:bifunctional peptidase and (3S)-lysyl hydroxylase JMJD7 [Vulpes lagopus]|uniref:bifunctional peptidase and (3S)-lysyl hydroxylase JMJD7 n=1 Tax=Vulpes lagopus TaxID=494514 RepID=UPI001BC95E11|nr:bifunctional peptidase and (3S)-lysyl hydroxylase JMJD7 [Vulpes lagopus]
MPASGAGGTRRGLSPAAGFAGVRRTRARGGGASGAGPRGGGGVMAEAALDAVRRELREFPAAARVLLSPPASSHLEKTSPLPTF